MAFIGDSRKDPHGSVWDLYVCLDVRDCELLLPGLLAARNRAERSVNYYQDLRDGGEATSGQMTKLAAAEERLERIGVVLRCAVEMIEREKKRKGGIR